MTAVKDCGRCTAVGVRKIIWPWMKLGHGSRHCPKAGNESTNDVETTFNFVLAFVCHFSTSPTVPKPFQTTVHKTSSFLPYTILYHRIAPSCILEYCFQTRADCLWLPNNIRIPVSCLGLRTYHAAQINTTRNQLHGRIRHFSPINCTLVQVNRACILLQWNEPQLISSASDRVTERSHAKLVRFSKSQTSATNKAAIQRIYTQWRGACRNPKNLLALSSRMLSLKTWLVDVLYEVRRWHSNVTQWIQHSIWLLNNE